MQRPLNKEKEKRQQLQEKLDGLKAEKPVEDVEGERAVERMRESNQQAHQMMTKDNERLLEHLQVAVDSTAADKARAEMDILHPRSARFVRVSEKDVDPELWKRYKESERARMSELSVLGQLRQECEHTSTICALFGHRIGALQAKALTERDGLGEVGTDLGCRGRPQRRRFSEPI